MSGILVKNKTLTVSGNVLKFNALRARARGAALLLAGIISPFEAAQDEARIVKQSADDRAAADKAAQFEARIVGNREALARLHRLSACAWPGVDIVKGRLTVSSVEAIPCKGSARKVNRGKSATEVFSPADIRARAAVLLRDGWRGKVAARAARMGKSGGMRWLKRNSRREALAMAEIGAAAGVNDRGAGVEWGRELQAICGAVYQRAAAYAVSIEAAPLPPCLTLLGGRAKFRASLVSRGKRAVGSGAMRRAAATWSDDKGRQVEAAEIETTGRGTLWQWAARQAGREMHAARYGLGGRDGREVAADWQACGTVSGSVSRWWDSLDDGAAFVGRRNPTRRPSFVLAARDSLALAIWSARRAVEAARREAAAAAVANDPVRRMTAGSALGAARRGLSAAVDRAEYFGAAMRGESLPPHVLAAWVEVDDKGARLTSAGRMTAKRLRDAMAARAAVSVPVRRAVMAGGAVAGDDVAAAASIAPQSLFQSGDSGEAERLRITLQAMAWK